VGSVLSVVNLSDIVKISADILNILSIAVAVAEFEKILIAAVDGGNPSGMFDRAPVLFGAGRYFLDIGNEAGKITAVSAIYFFNPIEVTQGLPIKDNILVTFYFWNGVNAKADELIEGDNRIQEQGGDDAGPDKRHGEDVQQVRIGKITKNGLGKQPVFLLYIFLEEDLFLMNFVIKFSLFFLDFLGKFILELYYFLNNRLDIVSHEMA